MSQHQSQKDKKYVIAVLPHAGPMLRVCAEKYRSLRLQILDKNPDQIFGSYEVERNLPFSYHESLVTQSDRYIIVAIVAQPSFRSTDEALEKGAWVGIEHVVGPVPLSDWTWPNIGGLMSDDEETRWHIYSLWVAPEHRRGGQLTKELRVMVLDLCARKTRSLLGKKALQEGREKLAFRRRCSLAAHNRAVGRFYEKLGWSSAGFITAEDAEAVAKLGYDMNMKSDGTADCEVLERIVEIPVEEKRSVADGAQPRL